MSLIMVNAAGRDDCFVHITGRKRPIAANATAEARIGSISGMIFIR
jgi:hypothetical protein